MRSSGEEGQELAVPERAGEADRERAEELVLRLIGSQADSLLRVARRYSLCADDAHDAYQRALEILMRHAPRLDPDRAAGWLHTVVKHEAMAINRSRRRIVGSAEPDLDALEARTSASPEERVIAADRVARSAEALHGLKPQEVRALWLKALGHSYQQICEATGWSYTKVNRCLAEGRKSFLERYAGIESGRECERLAPALSAFVDGEADAAQAVDLRMHLRQCLACRAAVRGLHDASRPLSVVFPATGLAVAGGGMEQAHGLFERVYETLTMHLHERAASSFLRAQAIVDTVTAGKMAAAAASAAALAGGGVAVEGVLSSPPAATPQAIVRRVDNAGATAIAKTSPQTHAHAKRSSHAGASSSGGPSRVRAAGGSRGAAAGTAADAAGSSRGTAGAPSTPRSGRSTAGNAAPKHSSPPRSGAPRATVASSGAVRGAGTSATSEFGFEGP
jgi:RNA polymerase sigma factor (sigma-70 family)